MITKEAPKNVTAEDVAHVRRINTEVRRWRAHCKHDDFIPGYLIIAYTKHMLDLGTQYIIYSYSGAPQYRRIISDTLVIIEETVMQPDFHDMEIRMEIIRLYHDAGYSTGGQYQMRL